MKINKFFGLLMILASAFLFVNCTSDPIPGPPGEDGIDGIDGIDGTDGVDGTASCVSCHSNATREPIFEAFALSAHASGSVGFAENRVGCAQCHGSDGFVEFIETGEALGPFSGDNTISCATCHSSHRTFDFENDGPDFALRNPDPTALVLAPSITLDFGDASNNCISCHQPRNSYPIPQINAEGTYVVNTSRFGPHYGPQSTLLEGILGAEIPGSEAYGAPGSAAHRSGSSCVQCHMGDATAADEGGHSWASVDAVCIQCHTNGVPNELGGFDSDMATLLALLQNVEGEGFDEDDDGNIIPNGDTVIGIIQADGSTSNSGIFSDVAAMAAWNYKTALQDQSRGVHNPGYIRALLKNSIEALQDDN